VKREVTTAARTFGAGSGISSSTRRDWCSRFGLSGSDNLLGGTGDDALTGGTRLRPFDGGEKNLVGGSGNDFVGGGNGSDAVMGGKGIDYVADGDIAEDNVLARAGNDGVQVADVRATQDIVTCGGGFFDRVLADRRTCSPTTVRGCSSVLACAPKTRSSVHSRRGTSR
jgi:hypothetical protein